MSVLEVMLIVEGVALAIMGVVGLVGLFISRTSPDDSIWIFCSTFWDTFLWPPEPMEIDAPGSAAAPTRRIAAPVSRPEPTKEDEFYGRVPKDPSGRVASVTVEILVEPNAATDEVVGRLDGGLKINVTGEAGDGRANKALIELVANAMGVKPYQVTLTKGHYQTRKAVQVQGVSQDELDVKLSAMADAGG